MTQHTKSDDLPLIRPEMRGNSRNERVATFSHAVFSRVTKRSKGRAIRGGHHARGRRAAATRKPAQFDRRTVIKARIVKMNTYGKKAMQLHLRYIERDGVEQDGTPGKLYGRDSAFNRDHFSRKIDNEKHQFRFIISPEDASELNLTDYTRTLMQQVEKDLGRNIEWAAVNHYNTDNPHTHIVIRGVDLSGQELRIDRDYISQGMRHRAAQISTQWLGQRTELDLENQMMQEVKQERFTSLDYQIKRAIQNNRFDIRDFQKNGFWLAESCIKSRLAFLQTMALATRDGAYHWRLKADWETTLRALGTRHDIIKNMHRNIGGHSNQYHIYDKQIENPLKLTGKIVEKGFTDELYDKQYIIVETLSGAVYHVDLDRSQSIADYRQNALIEVDTKEESWLKPADDRISAIARDNGGIYCPIKHKNRVVDEIGDMVKISGTDIKVTAEDFVTAHVNRLHNLVKYKLAEPLDDNRWKIHENLINELHTWDQEKPLRKLLLTQLGQLSLKQQQTYRGQIWLDQYIHRKIEPANGLNSVGAEVNQAAQNRIQFLRQLRIDPRDPFFEQKLDQLQVTDLSKTQAQATGRQAITLSQTALRGQLTVLEKLENDHRFSRIDTLDGKSFVLVPWYKSHDKLANQQVATGLSKTGAVWLKARTLGISR